MIVGFSGFGFPKAHGAAFGLLAYQSTWLRVHYGPEFLCALLNEQPMGFYASDTLVHEAQRRGIPMLPADVNESAAECTVAADGSGADRARLRQRRARRRGGRARRRARGGRALPLAGRPRLARGRRAAVAGEARVGGRVRRAGRRSTPPATGADRARRAALWQLGVAAPGRARARRARSSRCRWTTPRRRSCASSRRGSRWWPTTRRPGSRSASTRWRCCASGCRPARSPAATWRRMRHEAPVTIGGLVVARQRPGTAKGIVFLLLEDEFGTINLIVPPDVYERHRLTVRTEPLILARGRLEKLAMAGGAINVFVKRLEPLVTPGRGRRGRRRAGRAARRGRRGRGAGGPRRGRGGPERDPGRLPRRRPRGAELRGRQAEVGGALARRANK